MTTKMELLNRFAQDAPQRLLLARILDQQALSVQRGIPTHTNFLSPAEQAAAQPLLTAAGAGRFLFFGGFDEAERKLCAFLPDWQDEDSWKAAADCPVCALRVETPMASLSHRDFLGSLMGLRLTREKIGDILIHDDTTAFVLTLRDILPVLLSQWDKVGRYPLHLFPIPLCDLPASQAETKLIRDTVASLRLDAVMASGFSLSRSRAADLIRAGRVMLNHRLCEKPDQAVVSGAVISCRGLGKCVLTQAEGKSKKGRILLQLERYI